MTSVTNCVMCGLPVTEDAPGYVVPKTKIHHHCQAVDGRHPDDISDSLPCCEARNILGQLCGSIVQVEDKIPKDQLWVYNRTEKKVYRYRVFFHGQTLLELLPDPKEQP
jgi:hypothetical protein